MEDVMLDKIALFDDLENISEGDLFCIYALLKQILYGLDSSLDLPEDWQTDLESMVHTIEAYCTYKHFIPLDNSENN